MRRLCWYATVAVLVHATVVFWHLELLARVNAALREDQVPLLAALANIIPVIAVILLWARFPRIGGGLLLFLAVPLVIGGYSHFLSGGSDNVFRMAPGEWTTGFRASAALLWMLELWGCWLGIEIIRRSSLSVASA